MPQIQPLQQGECIYIIEVEPGTQGKISTPGPLLYQTKRTPHREFFFVVPPGIEIFSHVFVEHCFSEVMQE